MYDISKGLKLVELHIDNYKIFKDFTISFTDKNHEPLPIIILAGINGSGKTTLLEYMKRDDFLTMRAFPAENSVKIIKDGKTQLIKSSTQPQGLANYYATKDKIFPSNFEKDILYIPMIENNVKDVKESLLEFYRKKSRALDSHSKALKEIQNYIENIFESMNLSFRLEDINDVIKNKEEVTFKNFKGDTFNIENLSTGESTLLSKVLYLFLKEIKNSVILIDEPELSLHPSWQNRILKLYETFAINNNCQIIMATHSPHIIGGAKPEYVKLLVKENDTIKIIDEFSQSYGLEFSKILTDIMDVQYLRVPEVAEKLATIKMMIAQNDFDTPEFKENWQEMEEIFGKNYLDLKLLKLEIASRKKSVQN